MAQALGTMLAGLAVDPGLGKPPVGQVPEAFEFVEQGFQRLGAVGMGESLRASSARVISRRDRYW